MTREKIVSNPNITVGLTAGIAIVGLSLALKKIRQLKGELRESQELTVIDPLTKALNRRGFEEKFKVVLANNSEYINERRKPKQQKDSETSIRPLGALAIIDLDGFKETNDTHGHAAGDEVLTGFVKLVQNRTRATDLVARLGGDEFAVYMAETDEEAAAIKIEQLRQEVGKTFMPQGVTASIGVTGLMEHDTVEGALERADMLMYMAKEGKNQIITYADYLEGTAA